MQIIYVASFQLDDAKMTDNKSILFSILNIPASKPLIESSQYLRTTRNIRQGMVTFERRETAIDHGDNATMRNSGRKGLCFSIFLLENSGSSAGTELDALL
jgi:hypothetical protein